MRYSRLESVEEKRNLRNSILFILLSIVALVLIFVVGIPAVGKMATFVSGLKGSNKISGNIDHTPPAPPNFNTFPDFTNQQIASISGTAEPGSTVKLTFNGVSQNTLVDKDGNFTFQNLNLQPGDNFFSAVATDLAGNVGQKTNNFKIIFDNKPPALTITNPPDGSKYFGSTQRQVTIQGTTDSGASITINDRIVSVDDSGNFQYTLTLNSGDNKFTIKSVDQAGNSTQKDITLNFSE